MFDTNVFKKVNDPPRSSTDFAAYEKIKSSIASGEIEGFISETIFTLEGIKRAERKKEVGKRRGKVSFYETIDVDIVSQEIKLGPKRGIDFGDNDQLRQHFLKAMVTGFKIVRLPRIGGYVNEEVEPYRFQHGENLAAFHDRAHEVAEKIEQKGAGLAGLKALGLEFDSNWQKGLTKMPEERKNKIAELVGEWADGDSVATAIGLHCDYFCTLDQAKSAGQKSVLSSVNLAWLSQEYQFKTISPLDLASLIL